ncbi:MAG: adenylate kinase [Candidatus Aminicenantes bacterium]|nr:adenylate kinase [Candidatus Aminicenantes bacterium]NIM81546.1 adenylate kinase [Candidatus Aminicenantes bacterium]NIN20917.1 adenylate kinase [Candidatus Aminicenantes bacterium]NIN44738.1 adenylate kinase [Candidatus Aminicenantes bacterium]NIN87546.1 adenylate kinase [Candidatus Aminicenantes bacterium]
MKRVILFGAPGAGKGTQADMLEEKYGYKKISTGDLIRAEVAAKTHVGLEVKAIMEAGELVPDKTIIEILKKRLNQNDIVRANGYIMDGFPRTRPQAEELSRMEVDHEMAIYLNIVDEDVVVKRLMSRLTCSNCGAIFNVENNPPQKAGQCDFCAGPLRQRADDNEETIRKRIRVYRQQTQPVIDYYREKGLLHEIDASGSVEDIGEKLGQVMR